MASLPPLILNSRTRSFAMLLLCAGLAQGAWAQFKLIGPGFLPDENGTNLDNPQSRKVESNTVSGPMIKDCAECPEMLAIPAGSFEMGSNNNNKEQPIHRLNIASFLMGRTEVTQGEWQALMGSNPSSFTACGENCPVDSVNWHEAEEFVRRLSLRTGKRYRLPSEAEWEYAARAGSKTNWSFGDDAELLGEYAWFFSNSEGKSHQVAQKKPNSFGLYDMHGNVWEWVQDCYVSYSEVSTGGSAQTTACRGVRVYRGGCWDFSPAGLRSASRGGTFPGMKGVSGGGFRLARDL